jgi:hypothetical protein
MGLTTAEGKKLECFKRIAYNPFINTLNSLYIQIMPAFNLTLAISMCILQSLWVTGTVAALTLAPWAVQQQIILFLPVAVMPKEPR